MKEHGTPGRYRRGCRCDPCREGQRLDRLARDNARCPVTVCPFCEQGFRDSYFVHEAVCAVEYRARKVAI